MNDRDITLELTRSMTFPLYRLRTGLDGFLYIDQWRNGEWHLFLAPSSRERGIWKLRQLTMVRPDAIILCGDHDQLMDMDKLAPCSLCVGSSIGMLIAGALIGVMLIAGFVCLFPGTL